MTEETTTDAKKFGEGKLKLRPFLPRAFRTLSRPSHHLEGAVHHHRRVAVQALEGQQLRCGVRRGDGQSGQPRAHGSAAAATDGDGRGAAEHGRSAAATAAAVPVVKAAIAIEDAGAHQAGQAAHAARGTRAVLAVLDQCVGRSVRRRVG
jgi:hypothetical protein